MAAPGRGARAGGVTGRGAVRGRPALSRCTQPSWSCWLRRHDDRWGVPAGVRPLGLLRPITSRGRVAGGRRERAAGIGGWADARTRILWSDGGEGFLAQGAQGVVGPAGDLAG